MVIETKKDTNDMMKYYRGRGMVGMEGCEGAAEAGAGALAFSEGTPVSLICWMWPVMTVLLRLENGRIGPVEQLLKKSTYSCLFLEVLLSTAENSARKRDIKLAINLTAEITTIEHAFWYYSLNF